LDDFLRPRDLDEILTWQHLQSGVDESFLKQELRKAHTEEYTPDCRYHSCQKCGLCDFKTLQPIVIQRKRDQETATATNSLTEQQAVSINPPQREDQHFRYKVTYSRLGDICFLGHLEILQIVFRVLRRAKITTNFSQGFNPSPKVSFGPAMPVGTQSMAEYFIMDLPAALHDLDETQSRLNQQMPPGLTVLDIALSNGSIPQNIVSSYQISLRPASTTADTRLFEEFLSLDSFSIKRRRKGKIKEIDIRPLVVKLEPDDDGKITLELISRAAEAGAKPLEVVAAILQKDQEKLLASSIIKTGWQEL
jgi:radical SAM-linked protein